MMLIRIKGWAVVAACGCIGMMSASANTILDVGLNVNYGVGEVIPGAIGIPGGQLANDVADVNAVIGLAPGVTGTVNLTGANDNPNTVKRSLNIFSSLPSATSVGAAMASGVGSGTGNVNADGTSAYITLTGTGYGYLVAKYDGPNANAGAEVWNISGIAAGTTLQIPEFANVGSSGNLQAGTYFQITSWSLLNPSTSNVPDGGLTLVMLGSALSGLAILRRKLS